MGAKIFHAFFTFLIVVLPLIPGRISAGETVGDWEKLSPKPSNSALIGVDSYEGFAVGVGEYGAIINSTPEGSWVLQPRALNSPGLQSVAYGNGTWVVVGEYVILASSDGKNWGRRGMSPNYLFDVEWSGADFIVVGRGSGDTGPIFRSTDGANWSNPQTVESTLSGVACHGTTCVTVGVSGTIFVSIGGGPFSPASSTTTESLSDVIWGDDEFVAVGYNGTMVSSSDGINWAAQPTLDLTSIRDLAWNGTEYALVGYSGYGYPSVGAVFVGSDLSNLARTDMDDFTEIYCNLYSVAWVGEEWIAVGDRGLILTSADGITWGLRSSSVRHDFSCVAWGNGKFVAIGDARIESLPTSFISQTGQKWAVGGSFPLDWCADIAYGTPGFVAVGNDGDVVKSADGIEWTPVTSNVSEDLMGIEWCVDRFFAVGREGIILESANGLDWTLRYYSPGIHLKGIACSGEIIVATGYPDFIVTSSAGEWWTQQSSPASVDWIYDVSWGNGVFVAAADEKIFSSENGTAWVALPGSYPRLVDSHWTGEAFVLARMDAALMESHDGISWEETPTNLRTGGMSMATGLATVAVGERGTLLRKCVGVCADFEDLFSDDFESGDTTLWSKTVP